MNPGIWAAARAMDAVRRTDKAVERGWWGTACSTAWKAAPNL
jgi:hypothetical protein